MATYEDIERVNSEMTLTPVKNKDYAEVPERVKAFRKLHPNGSITSEIISINNGVVIMKATVADENGQILGTGHAYEIEGSSFINKTSYIENCETSAWGRALSACGFVGGASMAGAEEVQNAILGQEKITEEEKKLLLGYIEEKGVSLKKLLTKFNLKRIEDMSKVEYVKATRMINEVTK